MAKVVRFENPDPKEETRVGKLRSQVKALRERQHRLIPTKRASKVRAPRASAPSGGDWTRALATAARRAATNEERVAEELAIDLLETAACLTGTPEIRDSPGLRAILIRNGEFLTERHDALQFAALCAGKVVRKRMSKKPQ